MLRDRRQKIENDLRRSEEGKIRAAEMREELKGGGMRREKQAEEIRKETEARIVRQRRESQEIDSEALDDIRSQSRRGVDQIMHEARRALTDKVSDVMTAAAAERLSGSGDAAEKLALDRRFLDRLDREAQPTDADRARLQGEDVLRAELFCACEPALAERDRLVELLRRRFGKEQVRLDVTIDPKLIGGMKVKIGDTVYDGTLSHMRCGACRKSASTWTFSRPGAPAPCPTASAA